MNLPAGTTDGGADAAPALPAGRVPERRKRRRRRMIQALLTVVALWLAGDFVYSRVIQWRIGRWEAGLPRDADGIREGCRPFTIGPAARDAPAVLLIHGINDSPACFRDMAPRLAARGICCRAMLLPGFAISTERYAQADRHQWLAAVGDELRDLRQRHERVGVAAHSLGGAIAVRFLLDQLDRPAAQRIPVDKLVLLAPAIEVSSARSPVLSTRAWHRIANHLLLFTQVTESPFGLDAVALDERDYPFRTPFTPRRIVDETFALIDLNAGQAPRLQVPLLLAVSRDDHVIDWEAAERFYEAYGSPTKQVYYADPAGHALTLDQGWETLTDTVAAFLLR